MPRIKRDNEPVNIVKRTSNAGDPPALTAAADLAAATALAPPTAEEIKEAFKTGTAAAAVIAHPARPRLYNRIHSTIEEVRADLAKLGKELLATAIELEGNKFSLLVSAMADWCDLKANEKSPGIWQSAKDAGVDFDSARKFLREAIGYTKADQTGKEGHNYIGKWASIDGLIKLTVQAAVLVQAGHVSHKVQPKVPGEPMRIAWVSKFTHMEIIDSAVEELRKKGQCFRAVTAPYANMKPAYYDARTRAWVASGEERRFKVDASCIRAQYAYFTGAVAALDEGGNIPKKAPETQPFAEFLRTSFDKLSTDERLHLFEAVQMALEDVDTLRTFIQQGDKAAEVLSNFWATVHHTFDDNGHLRPLGDLELDGEARTA